MKITIAVLFGCASVEHEISIISALQAMEYIDKEKYNVIPIYVTRNNEMYTSKECGNIESYKDIKGLIKKSQRVVLVNEGKKHLIKEYPAKLLSKGVLGEIDIAFPIVHGTNCEDGTLQGYLSMLNIPYVGCDVLSSAIGMDKYVMKTVLADNDIPVLKCRVVNDYEFSQNQDEVLNQIEQKFNYPIIVKPINLGSSVGISKAKNRQEAKKALENAFNFALKVLVESAIVNLKEINCSVIGDYQEAQASVLEEPVACDEILSYEDKYIGGGKSSKTGGSKGMASLKRKIPADIDEKTTKIIQDYAVKAFKVLGCNGVSRIDFMIDNDTNEIWFNEINTIPGSLSFYLWEPVGLKYKDMIEKLIQITLKRERLKSNITYDFETNVLSQTSFKGSKGSKR